jgi:aryl-alcohol dehydrogenase-like predicted oxidoreductase
VRRTTNSAEHIQSYLEDSTKRLGSAPDLYYLHRRDPNTPLSESIATLDRLKKEGKVRYIGLSEVSVETLREACESES